MYARRRIARTGAILSMSLAALFAIQPAPAVAAGGGNCFERASGKINAGSRIDLVTTDGNRVSGRVQFIDFREKVLTLEPAESPRDARTFRLNEVSRIQYRSSNSSAAWMWGGAAAGTLVGLIVWSARSNTDGRGGDGAITGGLSIIAGGVTGFVIGAVVPSATSSSHTIVCEPAIAEGP